METKVVVEKHHRERFKNTRVSHCMGNISIAIERKPAKSVETVEVVVEKKKKSYSKAVPSNATEEKFFKVFDSWVEQTREKEAMMKELFSQPLFK